MTLGTSVLNFPWKYNMVQTKESISKFPQKWHCVLQFSISLENTTCFKARSRFLSFVKNGSGDFSSQLSLKIQHGSNQVDYF